MRHMKKVHLCHQQMTVVSYFYVVHYDLCILNFFVKVTVTVYPSCTGAIIYVCDLRN